jgi:hypothetical protein
MLTEAGLEQVRDEGFAVAARRGVRSGWIEAVEDEQVAFGVVECREFGNALEMIEGSERVHFVVFNLVPGDIPARAIGLHADGKVHGTEIVADRGYTGHER